MNSGSVGILVTQQPDFKRGSGHGRPPGFPSVAFWPESERKRVVRATPSAPSRVPARRPTLLPASPPRYYGQLAFSELVANRSSWIAAEVAAVPAVRSGADPTCAHGRRGTALAALPQA